jgi:hypothetical protein
MGKKEPPVGVIGGAANAKDYRCAEQGKGNGP